MSAPSSPRRLRRSAPGPGPGAGGDRDPERTAVDVIRIVLVATIVVGQLWALTIALDAYFAEAMATVGWLVGFQAVSFAAAVGVWLVAPGEK
jgi:hypothetical protein